MMIVITTILMTKVTAKKVVKSKGKRIFDVKSRHQFFSRPIFDVMAEKSGKSLLLKVFVLYSKNL